MVGTAPDLLVLEYVPLTADSLIPEGAVPLMKDEPQVRASEALSAATKVGKLASARLKEALLQSVQMVLAGRLARTLDELERRVDNSVKVNVPTVD